MRRSVSGLMPMAGVLLLAGALVAQQTSDSSPFTGKGVEGGGSQCDSDLRIRAQAIDWNTTHSSCMNTPFDKLTGKPGEFVYRLKTANRRCMFKVLVVSKVEDAWMAVGFTTEAAWRKQDDKHELVCAPLF